MAAFLASYFTVYSLDRRGHGQSGETPPYAVDRKIADFERLIAEAGSSAFLFGGSVNGVLALEVAACLPGLVKKVAVCEPPYIEDDSRPPVAPESKAQLTRMRAENRQGDMVALFFTEAVGLPAGGVAQMRNLPFWPSFEAIAHTLIYDAEILRDFSIPVERFRSIQIPTLVLDGGEAAWPWMRSGVLALFSTLPNAQPGVLNGQPHTVAASFLVPALVEFFN